MEAVLSIKNIGSRLLSISSVDLRLQSMDLATGEAGALAGLCRDCWPKADPSGQPIFNEAELQWPVIKRFANRIHHEIEPGETDFVIASFVVPCSIHNLRLASSVEKGSRGAMFWKVRSYASTKDACSSRKDA